MRQKNNQMKYTAIIEKGNNGWFVGQCAQIPAAITQGKTVDETLENLKDAVALVLQYPVLADSISARG